MNVLRRLGLNLLILAVGMLTAALAGCGKSGPAVGEVSGKVTFKGKPVELGTISFRGATTGDAAEVELGAGGAYTVPTPLQVGEYKVWITPGKIKENENDPKTPWAWTDAPAKNIPPKYRGEGSTPLTTTIKEGKNEANFDMLP